MVKRKKVSNDHDFTDESSYPFFIPSIPHGKIANTYYRVSFPRLHTIRILNISFSSLGKVFVNTGHEEN